METSVCFYQFQNSIRRVAFDPKFDPNSPEDMNRLRETFDRFKSQVRELGHSGDGLLQKGEGLYNRIVGNLDKIVAARKELPSSIRIDQKV